MSSSFPVDKIRNIGIIAHIDAGKTTVTERILYNTGKNYKLGNVDDGNTTTDWMAEEKARGITIVSAAITCEWKGYRLNLIDTPGHVDFTAEVERSLRVLDGGVVVFDGVAGVEAQSETVWRQANRYSVPRICFVNKMDRTGADYFRCVEMIKDRLKAKPLPIMLPIGSADTFKGVMDLIEGKAYLFENKEDTTFQTAEIPADQMSVYEENRNKLIEILAESDDEIMNAYLDGAEITNDQIRAAIRKETLTGLCYPVLCGSALKNKGVQMLLDAGTYHLPCPTDMPPIKAIDPKTEEPIHRDLTADEPFAALAFKVVADPYVGRLVYLRMYSGKIQAGGTILNSTRGEKERTGRLLLMHSNRHEEIEESEAGNIIAAIGLKDTLTGDTLCDIDHPILLESFKFPEPVLSVAVEPKTRADRDKMIDALTKLSEEDPTFKVKFDEATGQTIISGMGELHVDVLISRLLTEFKVGANIGAPRVAYKETLKSVTKAEGKFIRQSGGRGQYGHVLVEFAPLEHGKGFEFVDMIKGGVLPREYIKAAEAGIKDAMEAGGRAGYPVVDIRATLYDGSFHEVDSSDMAFKMAGSMALKDAFSKSSAVLLEPVMSLEVVTPEQYMGDIIGDLSSRRGQVEAIENHGDTSTLHGILPLANTFGYATDLRSMSQGRATYSMEFKQYQELPANLAEEIRAEAAGK